VPAGSSVNVPVKLPVPNLESVSSDWLAEAVKLRPGLLVARTLLPDCDKYAAVPVVDVSGRYQILHSDLCIGQAVPGVCLSDCFAALSHAHRVDAPASGNKHKPAVVERELHATGEAMQGTRDLYFRNMTSDNALQCAAVDCQQQSGASADNRSLIDFSNKSDVELYDMFQGDFAHVKPLLDCIPADVVRAERRRVAELILCNADVFLDTSTTLV